MKRAEQIHNLGLTATLLMGLLVLGKVVLTPTRQPQTVTYTFPEQIPLETWQFDRSDSLDEQRSRGPALITSMNDLSISSRNYRYSRNGQQLDIAMRYFVEGTYGDVSQILRDSNLQRRKPDMSAKTSAQGSYVLFTESGTPYLSACIAPTHRTTTSEAEFRGEQNRPQVIASRLFPWLLGIAPLRDLRCVWTKMSIRPMTATLTSPSSTNPKGALTQQQELEQAWQQWAQWWKQNYPPEPERG